MHGYDYTGCSKLSTRIQAHRLTQLCDVIHVLFRFQRTKMKKKKKNVHIMQFKHIFLNSLNSKLSFLVGLSSHISFCSYWGDMLEYKTD